MATSEQYRDLILKLLPGGKAWTRDADSWLYKFSWGMAEECARIDARARTLLREIDPRYTDELLLDFEKEYGLPDACSVIADSIETRRRDLIARITAYGGQSVDYFVSLLEEAGTTITVSEFEPTRAGDRAGSRLRGRAYRHVWNVTIPVGAVSYFTAGFSSAGDALSTITADKNVVCFIDKNKPAHTYVTYTFTNLPTT